MSKNNDDAECLDAIFKSNEDRLYPFDTDILKKRLIDGALVQIEIWFQNYGKYLRPNTNVGIYVEIEVENE